MTSTNSGAKVSGEQLHVALLTGCQDRSYAVGLATALAAGGVKVDLIGGDSMDGPDIRGYTGIRLVNLRGSQAEDALMTTKVSRVLWYYARLMAYAVTAQPRMFHILWNNKFESFDRTLLMLWYKLWRRRVVLTVHNVNAAARDECDSPWNRFTLRCQYHLANHVLVHAERLRKELQSDFGLLLRRSSQIPFGINDTLPVTSLTKSQARSKLGLDSDDRVALFFGQIAPYKGLHWLVQAIPALVAKDPTFFLIIAGKVKRGAEEYFLQVSKQLADLECSGRVRVDQGHVADCEVEAYFKAADVVILPYERIFQSGVPFVAFWFGRPVIAAAVGSLPEDILVGSNGLLCDACSVSSLADTVFAFFESDLYRLAEDNETEIRRVAQLRHSWSEVASRVKTVYTQLR